MTVGELEARLSSRELTEWIAFDHLEPIGIYREDLNAAKICTAVANAFRGKGRAAQPSDYMIDYEQASRTRLGFGLFNKISAVMAANGIRRKEH